MVNVSQSKTVSVPLKNATPWFVALISESVFTQPSRMKPLVMMAILALSMICVSKAVAVVSPSAPNPLILA